MSAPTSGGEPPVIPPKDRSPSPDDGLLREEPLESEVKSTTPAKTAPPTDSSTVTAPELVSHALIDENPPPKPPRPVSKFEQDVATLAEAFPGIDIPVIKAVLTASGGRIDPAFNALLGMSDPSAATEIEHPPPQPPRPRQPAFQDVPGHQTSTPMTQLEADEMYARQLAEHYGGGPGGPGQRERRQGRGGFGNYPEQIQGRPTRRHAEHEGGPNNKEDRSFMDDLAEDLPVIRDNIQKGFKETQTKFNKWIGDLGKKFGGEEEEGTAQAGSAQTAGRQTQGQGQYPQRGSSRSRRSGDAYDADPTLVSDDFSHLELRDETGETNQPGRRPKANPNLFASDNNAPGGRKVNFANQSEEDLYRRPAGGNTGPLPSAMRSTSPGGPMTQSTTTQGSKWAPLAAVEPTPLTNDPFQLADSDDEHETVTTSKTGPQESGVKPAK